MDRPDAARGGRMQETGDQPQCHPKRPAIGASVVPNRAASSPRRIGRAPRLTSGRNTPIAIGTMFSRVLAVGREADDAEDRADDGAR